MYELDVEWGSYNSSKAPGLRMRGSKRSLVSVSGMRPPADGTLVVVEVSK